MTTSRNTLSRKVFLDLVQAGLWEKEVRLASFEKIAWDEVIQLAHEQSVLGLILAGLEHCDVKPPQEMLLQMIAEVQMLEQRNKAMNKFVATLIDGLRRKDVYALLVKGQGVAQCYERAFWRACGDVDLLLNSEDYDKARAYVSSFASSVEEEDKKRKHLGLVIDGWVVELHGTLHTRQLPRLNKVIDTVQNDVFYNGNVRSWKNGDVTVYIPSADNDVFFVFSHILQHYFGGGIGLRQLCDWCRLMWTYKDSLNHELLETRISRAGVMTEWKAFAALAVDYLGMPVETVPLYSSDKYWKRKALRIKNYIFKTGNFGHNRDDRFRKGSAFGKKIGSLKRYTVDTVRHFFVFPLDSVRVWCRMVISGFRA